MWSFKIIVFFLCAFPLVFSQENNTQVKKCRQKDSNFQECLKKYVQYNVQFLTHDLPLLRLRSLDPLETKNVVFPRGKIADFETEHDFLNFYGFSKLQVDNFEINFENYTIMFDFVVPNLRWETRLRIKNGTIYNQDINAEGYGIAWCENWTFKNTIKFIKRLRSNDMFLELINFNNVILPGNISVKLLDINSNNNLNVARFEKSVSGHLSEIWKDAGRSYEQYIGKLIFNYFNTIFTQFSLSKLFD